MKNRSKGFDVVKKPFLLLLVVLAGCSRGEDIITYVCEEPLEKYMEQARVNIQNDYELERSQQLLTACPESGFHRRYSFSFQTSSLVSKQPREARVKALWCNASAERTIEADLKVLPGIFVFQFTYPWSTATGKYPSTEFRLNRNTLRGGFFDDIEWSCVLERPEKPAT